MAKPRVLVAYPSVPYTSGGAERLVEDLVAALNARAYDAEPLSIPFIVRDPSSLVTHAAIWREMPLANAAGESADLLISTKFPSYLLQHPNKVVWLVHQYRQLYELFGTRYGEFSGSNEQQSLRRLLMQADKVALEECRARFAISENVAARLKRFLGLQAESLLPPLPLEGRYYSKAAEPYFLSVGRLCSIKRVDLAIKALPSIPDRFTLKIVGVPDEPGVKDYLDSVIEKHHLQNRAEFLGRVSTDELFELYARATAVIYPPFDEDYGYVTLEAFASAKPVITCADSGGTLQFVRDGKNGFICAPEESELAAVINRLIEDTELYAAVCAGARDSYVSSTWDQVVEKLTAPLRGEEKLVGNS